MRRDSESESREHARRIALDRCVHKGPDPCEFDDLVVVATDLLAAHPEDCRRKSDIVDTGEVRVEPDTELDEGRDPSTRYDPSLRRCDHASQKFEQRRLSGAVRPYYANDLFGFHRHREVP